MNYLYYSNRCESSKNLLRVLNSEGILGAFKCICIDNINKTSLINSGIKGVPTLIIKGETGGAMYEREDAFRWVENIIKFKRHNMMMAMVKENRQKIADHNKMMQNSGPLGWKPEEMSGVSDEYSYLKTDCAQPKSFLPYGQDDQYQIVTIVDNGQKISPKEQEEVINKYADIRNQQTQHIKENMEKSQLDTVMNSI